MSHPSAATDSRARPRAWLPLVVALSAFAIGLLLFLLLWWQDRRGDDAADAPDLPRSAEGRVFAPLPAPLPADRSQEGASGMPDAPDEQAQPPRPTQPPLPPMPPVPAAPPPAEPVPVPPDAIPQVVRNPPPRYPRGALRRGEAGTVVLRVQVDAAGGVADVQVASSSRSRLLDRAAAEAVRRWRFRPALRDGQAVPGEVQVPITFELPR